jgi:hypothetical protein
MTVINPGKYVARILTMMLVSGIAGSAFAQSQVIGVVGGPTFETNTSLVDKTSNASLKAPLPVLNLDFENLGDLAMVFELRAPAGKLIEVRVPSGDWPSGMFNFAFTFEDTVSGTIVGSEPLSISFVDGQGNLPSFTGETAEMYQDSNEFFLFAQDGLQPGQVFRFRAIRAALTIPIFYSGKWIGSAVEFELQANLTSPDPQTADPAPWIRFVDAPEVVLKNKLKKDLKKLQALLRKQSAQGSAASVARLKKQIAKIVAKLKKL